MTPSTSRATRGGKAPGVVGSATLHIGVLAAAAMAWTLSRNIPDTPSEVIPVEMVDVADVTNIRPQSTQPKPDEQPLEAVTPTPAVEIPKPAPAPPADETPPPPQQEATTEEPAPAPPPPVHKPHPAKPSVNVDDIINKLASAEPHTAQSAAAPRAAHNQRGIGDMSAATADIQAAFLQQIRECWNFPVGAPHPEQLVVQVEVSLSRDGHLVGAPQLSADTRAAMSRDPYMRAAGEAALRAISICEPYRLPADRYDQWRDLNLVFDPSKMVGR